MVSFGRGLTFSWFSLTLFWFWAGWEEIYKVFFPIQRDAVAGRLAGNLDLGYGGAGGVGRCCGAAAFDQDSRRAGAHQSLRAGGLCERTGIDSDCDEAAAESASAKHCLQNI